MLAPEVNPLGVLVIPLYGAVPLGVLSTVGVLVPKGVPVVFSAIEVVAESGLLRVLDPEVGPVLVLPSKVALEGELAPKIDSPEVLAPKLDSPEVLATKAGPVGALGPAVGPVGVLAWEVSCVAVLVPEAVPMKEVASKSASVVLLASEESPVGELPPMTVADTLAREGGEEVTEEPAEAADTGGEVPLGMKLPVVLSDVI